MATSELTEAVIRGMDFVRFTDAKVARAFKHAIEAWHNDMKLGEYAPSDVAEEAFKALGLCIQEAIEEAAIVEIVPNTPTPKPVTLIKADDAEDELYQDIAPPAKAEQDALDDDDE